MRISGSPAVEDPSTGRATAMTVTFVLGGLRVSSEGFTHVGMDGKTYSYGREP
ncbi:MAG: hypothetical protein HY927_00645 [Elusimicrobia bacterium]|nr:hypothetical protein [Elusimicrobiota bacterium]